MLQKLEDLCFRTTCPKGGLQSFDRPVEPQTAATQVPQSEVLDQVRDPGEMERLIGPTDAKFQVRPQRPGHLR
jgi:hypothetical protein